MTDVYRSGASILLLRTAGEVHEVLLLHKPRKNDAWQLPQGGVEAGETVRQAALRELREEAGISSCVVLGESTREYSYDFPASYRRFRPDNVCGQSIRFVLALADADATVQVDGQEVDGFVWVGPAMLPSYIRRAEYTALVRALYDEAVEAVARLRS